MSDELDDYQEGAERAEAREDEHEQELALADAAQLDDIDAEQDETRFDETRLAYSGVEEGDGDVDVQELEEAGARARRPGARGTAEGSLGAANARLLAAGMRARVPTRPAKDPRVRVRNSTSTAPLWGVETLGRAASERSGKGAVPGGESPTGWTHFAVPVGLRRALRRAERTPPQSARLRRRR